jgi:hypothetical protein
MSQNEDFTLETDDGMILETDDAPSWETKNSGKVIKMLSCSSRRSTTSGAKMYLPSRNKRTPIRKPTVDTPSTSRPDQTT